MLVAIICEYCMYNVSLTAKCLLHLYQYCVSAEEGSYNNVIMKEDVMSQLFGDFVMI